MPREERYIYAVAERVRGSRSKKAALEIEIRRRVTLARAAAGLAPVPPIDLLAIARHLGSEVRRVPLSMRGRLLLEGTRLAIEINENLEPTQASQTLAHELGHMVLEERRLADCVFPHGGGKATSRREHDAIERMCDVAAEEMILPTDWLRDRVGLRPSLALARELSQIARCDVELVARRAIHLGMWDAALFVFQSSRAELFIVRSFPPRDEISLSGIDILDEAAALVRKCLAQSVSSGTLGLGVDGLRQDYEAECLALGPEVALAMVRFG